MSSTIDAPGRMLDTRALNRALLARQMLLSRSAMSASEMVEHLVGIQAQAPTAGYVGLWTRLTQFRLEDLTSLMESRGVTRIALLRNTIHLVTARDCLRLRPLLQPVIERMTNSQWRRRVEGVDLDELAEVGRDLFAQQPLTWAELGKLLTERWPEHDGNALATMVRGMLPLVQIPPRGIWGRRGPAAHATVESWLGGPLDADYAVEELALRYLSAFGPATVQDMAKWSGLTGVRAVFDRLADRLVTVHDESGATLYDVPDGPRPDGNVEAPVRFLPEFDNLLLSHVDRDRILAREYFPHVFVGGGSIRPTFLVDGFVRGVWSIARKRGEAALVVKPFTTLREPDRSQVAEEGARLLSFAASDASRRDIRFE